MIPWLLSSLSLYFITSNFPSICLGILSLIDEVEDYPVPFKKRKIEPGAGAKNKQKKPDTPKSGKKETPGRF